MENLHGSQVTHSQEILLMIILLDSAFWKIKKWGVGMKENFLIIKLMALAPLFGKMVTNTKGNFLKDKKMDMVFLLLVMERR
jgi:hypothetical protein